MEKNEIILWIGIIQWVHMKSNLLTRLVLCQIYQLLAHGLIKKTSLSKKEEIPSFQRHQSFNLVLRYNFNQKKCYRFYHIFIHLRDQDKQENNSSMKCNKTSFTSQFATIIDFIWHERKMIYILDICCYCITKC